MVETAQMAAEPAGPGRAVPRLGLFEPDIPQNTGTLFRLAACFGIAVDLVEPAGFDSSDRNLRRAGLDYLGHVEIVRHVNFSAFEAFRHRSGLRLVLATTRATLSHVDAAFRHGDIILLGRESAGVPEAVHEAADLRIRIPMRPGLRSLNIAVAGAIILGEAMRQTGGFAALSSREASCA